MSFVERVIWTPQTRYTGSASNEASRKRLKAKTTTHLVYYA